MALNRPPSADIFAIVAQATPKLAELQAIKSNVDAYTATAQQYAAKATAEQAKAAAITEELGEYADQLVELYGTYNPVETPEDPPTDDPTDPPADDPTDPTTP